MKKDNCVISFLIASAVLVTLVLGCGGAISSAPDWAKSKKIAGKEQKFSHISGLMVDDKFAYVSVGGNLADQQAGLSGIRKVSLEDGAVTVIDDGKINLPQSDYGGMAVDDKYFYWNSGGKISRCAKDGTTIETIATENVGIGLDLVVDNEKVYWANHGYYSPGQPSVAKPIFSVAKGGGKAEVFAADQMVPRSLVVDEKFVYWHTASALVKQAKSGGGVQEVYKVSDKEGLDQMSQDADNLYFGYRPAGDSRWALRKVAKSGGEPVTLVKQYSLKPVVIDDANIYFFDEETMNKDAICRVPKNGGDVSRLDTGYSSGVIAQNKGAIFFAALDDILSIQK